MGAIVSRFRGKPDTIEVLEGIEKEIQRLQKLKHHNVDLQKRMIGSLILYSILLYILAAIIFYFYYMPDAWQDRALCSLPLLFFPFLIYLVKRFLHWYFIKRISRNDGALEELKDKKKEILEEVMEKETYKKAKDILEKFDPERFKKLEKAADNPNDPKTPQGQEIRQRQVNTGQQPFQTPMPPGATPAQPMTGGPAQPMGTPHLPRKGQPPGRPPQATPMSVQRNGAQPGMYGLPPGPPMPRPILPRERTAFDKLVDGLVGDGPQNRYALICSRCYSHNGMALKEEFEYLSFRCCYCYHPNPARKQRPNAPRLDGTPVLPRRQLKVQPSTEGTDSEREDEIKDNANPKSEKASQPGQPLPGKQQPALNSRTKNADKVQNGKPERVEEVKGQLNGERSEFTEEEEEDLMDVDEQEEEEDHVEEKKNEDEKKND